MGRMPDNALHDANARESHRPGGAVNDQAGDFTPRRAAERIVAIARRSDAQID